VEAAEFMDRLNSFQLGFIDVIFYCPFVSMRFSLCTGYRERPLLTEKYLITEHLHVEYLSRHRQSQFDKIFFEELKKIFFSFFFFFFHLLRQKRRVLSVYLECEIEEKLKREYSHCF